MNPSTLFTDIDFPLPGGSSDHHEHNLRRLDHILSGFYSLAGGIIFATVFIDIIPHTQVMLNKYEKEVQAKVKFPVIYCLVCMGFLLTFFFEELSRKLWRFQAKLKLEQREPYSRIPGMKKRRKESNLIVAAIVFFAAMSVHSFLDGFTLLQNTTNRIVELLLALLLHKVVESISTGDSEQAKREKIIAIVTAVLVFGLMIPLGSAVGSLVDVYEMSEDKQQRLTLVFEAMAGGIFIYVAMMEIIDKQRTNTNKREVHMWLIFIGFMLVVGLHLTFGTVVLRVAGGDEERDYPEIFEEQTL